ncbi:TetR/AcrR family transcriptional regulator [Dyadobacter subterraneus]|uniref:TetR/AcrR family transcriptional regulator n=1 Tax=Dyadobacter subterraneus TaxID=2773304 RepID=A0ABR9WEM7_9BACT|nr:TetR/AcrR family transcriptional regulator [Dyadobacter subterraneus]MBE9463848.1 TetR/AcrR family transcriptional regulator [Dyadobacter subterraneus]
MRNKERVRDRQRTEQKIIVAVGEIIKKHGVDQIGINAITKTAGVNKVLIYRHS